MNHWIIAPVVLPALLAPFILMVIRYHLDLQRIFSIAGTAALVLISLVLTGQTLGGDIHVYELGDWPAPFGIVLVLDRLSATMCLLTAVLALESLSRYAWQPGMVSEYPMDINPVRDDGDAEEQEGAQ